MDQYWSRNATTLATATFVMVLFLHMDGCMQSSARSREAKEIKFLHAAEEISRSLVQSVAETKGDLYSARILCPGEAGMMYSVYGQYTCSATGLAQAGYGADPSIVRNISVTLYQDERVQEVYYTLGTVTLQFTDDGKLAGVTKRQKK